MIFAALMAAAVAGTGVGADSAEARLRERIPVVLERAEVQFKALAADFSKQPETAAVWRPNPDGTIKYGTLEGWTSGFFPGSLWYLYELTGKDEWRKEAKRFTDRLERLRHFNGHHDIGFMLMCSVGNGLRLTKDANYAAILRDGAEALMTRYRPKLRTIQSWNTGDWCGFPMDCPVIIDNMMNLELLEWTARTTGEGKYDEVARTHADTTDRNHFRADDTAYHIVNYNSKNGKILAYYAGQGASADGAWSRGQAWAIHGFTMMYRETREERYLRRAVRSAEAFLKEPSTPADGIPYWDFRAAEIPDAPRDASAAAIAASAMLELATFAKDGARYRAAAVRMLNSLCSDDYLSPVGANAGFLLMHSTGNAPRGNEMDVPLTYADYYFLEALKRFRDGSDRLTDAFAKAEFDPSAPGCATFIVIGDPHVPWSGRADGGVVGDKSAHLAGRIAEWNAMRPRPAALLSMGDQISTVSGEMGDRWTIQRPDKRKRAVADIRLFRSYFEKLEIPFYQTVGNHDCYPGETNAAFYASQNKGWIPYERFEIGGATFFNLCGGHDGSIDPGQRAWLAKEVASVPKDRTVFLITHYPNVGVGRVDGYDIGVVIREFFSNRSADTWLLAGHNHEDATCRYSLPGGGRLYVATHALEVFGYRVYCLKEGGLVARVLVPFDRKTGVWRGEPELGPIGTAIRDRGPLLLPFEHEGEKLLWTQFLGKPGDDRYRVSVEADQRDAGSYFFYVGRVVYRLPLGGKRAATRFGIYGKMLGHRKTHEPETLEVSADGENWQPVADPWRTSRNTCYAFNIPESLRGGEWLYVRVGGFGLGCDSSLAGFALMR